MKTNKGFTLIELLIVVTIIAILAGAAIPYVQDYVEQTRSGRAKADLDEIKRAIMLYEAQFGTYTSDNIASLVGPFLTKNIPDPWSSAYVVSNAKSTVYSYGPDGKDGTGDEIIVEYRPRMAVTRAYYLDANGDGLLSTGDALHIVVCRPASGDVFSSTGLTVADAGGAVLSSGDWLSGTLASFTFTGVAPDFRPGSSTLGIAANNAIVDQGDNKARADTLKILYQ